MFKAGSAQQFAEYDTRVVEAERLIEVGRQEKPPGECGILLHLVQFSSKYVNFR
jgi:hypothetical protein